MLKLFTLAIRAQFATNAPVGVTVVYDNAPAKTIAPDAPWIRLSVRPGASKPITAGPDPIHRMVGRVEMSVFVPVANGDATLLDLGDQCEAVFRNWTWEAGSTYIKIDSFERTFLPEEKWYSVKISALWSGDIQPS